MKLFRHENRQRSHEARRVYALQVIEKHGPDLEACARDLAALTEWDAMLDDLQEMGFGDRSLNKKLMIKHDGSLKRTVKDLVTDGA